MYGSIPGKSDRIVTSLSLEALGARALFILPASGTNASSDVEELVLCPGPARHSTLSSFLSPEDPLHQLAELCPLALHQNADPEDASGSIDAQSGGRQHDGDSGHGLPPGGTRRNRQPRDH